MGKEKAIIFSIILSFSIFCFQPVRAEQLENLTINGDGSISPATTLIQQTNTLYNLTGDIDATIIIRSNNVVLDGNGHKALGLSLQGVVNVTVKNLIVTFAEGERIGISLNDASNNLITNNTVTGFESIQAMNGILFAGIRIKDGGFNTISHNNLTYNLVAIQIVNSSSNKIAKNDIISDPITNYHGPYSTGVYSLNSSDNIIYNNNLVNCTYMAQSLNSVNTWDNGFSEGGNYWGDYRSKYSNASAIDDSGIGDTAYYIDNLNEDNYPLITPFISSSVDVSETPIPSNSKPTTVNNPTTDIIVLATSVTVVVLLLSAFCIKKHHK